MSELTRPANLRSEMPFTTAVIDDFRAVFGKDEIDAEIKAGIRGAPRFYAREGGQEIGTRFSPDPAKVVSVAHMVLALPPAEEVKKSGRR